MPAQRDPNTGRFVRATPPDVLEVIERRDANVPARPRRRVPTGWIVAVFAILVLAVVAVALLP